MDGNKRGRTWRKAEKRFTPGASEAKQGRTFSNTKSGGRSHRLKWECESLCRRQEVDTLASSFLDGSSHS